MVATMERPKKAKKSKSRKAKAAASPAPTPEMKQVLKRLEEQHKLGEPAEQLVKVVAA